MAAGDASRVWFPELVEILRRDWRRSLSMEELIQLRDRLDATLQRIRSKRKIRTPRFRCRNCGQLSHAEPPKVSVRAMILSLRRFGLASADEVQALEKAWASQRRRQKLDLHGKQG
jgi:hypothetical protein